MKFVIFLKVFVGLSHLYVNRYDEVCNIFKAYYYLWLTIDFCLGALYIFVSLCT